MSMTIQSDVKDKILATPGEMSKVENAPAEMLRDLDQQIKKRADDGCTLWINMYSKYEYEIRYHPGRANVVIDALRRKERVKPRLVRAMAMTIQYGGMMRTVVMDEAHASRFRWMIYLVVLADAAESVSDAIRFEYCLASSSGWTKSLVIWAEIRGSSLIGPELVQETTNKFEVGDRVMLKVSPWKGDIRFGKNGKLAPIQMHNNIMAAGSRDRPPMLATGRYAQWRSRFLRYIDTRPNGDALRKCILKGPYTPTIVTTLAVPATEDSPAVPEQTTVETVTNMTPENRAHFE
ncbi:hypothetical protein Tco_1538849 [Tanacetum coccineum]